MESKPTLIQSYPKDLSKTARLALIGGKAEGLFHLRRYGLRVPEWSVITSHFFARSMERDETLAGFLRSGGRTQAKAKALRESITSYTFSEDDYAFLVHVYMKISKKGAYPVAVRSSAADEDSATFSFAGQMDTFLNVRDVDAFITAVKNAWASLYTDRALSYREEQGIPLFSAGIALVVQRMVRAESAGVLFTANTVSGARDKMLASAVFGLGEGLVSGRLDADTYTLSAKGRVLEKYIVTKEERAVYNEESGITYEPVPETEQTAETLTPGMLRALFRAGKKIEQAEGTPMDIEFAFERKRLYVLQARPITTLAPQGTQSEAAKKRAYENFLVWDNSNIVESYAGVTTPLTFTFIRMAYTNVYRTFCEVVGVDKKTIRDNEHLFKNMLGLLHGRVYYNLLNWYRLVALLPGFSYNKAFMEEMMGLSVVKDYISIPPPKNAFEKYFVHLPRLIKMGLRLLRIFFSLDKRIKGFFDRFYATYNEFKHKDFDACSVYDLMTMTRSLEKEILKAWKEPILNDLKGMIFYGVLKRLTTAWNVDTEGALQNDLLAGEGDITSKKVVTELFRIARMFYDVDDETRNAFADAKPANAYAMLDETLALAPMKEAFSRYLDEYGVRSVEEMKLESTPVRDNPHFAIAMLQNYIRANVPSPDEQEEREQAIRAKAEATAKERLKGKRAFFVVPRWNIYRFVLRHARASIRDRENQRFCRSEIYSVMRDIVRTIGRKWYEAGVLDDAEDIFYIEWDEIWSFVEGTATTPDFKGLVRLRKRLYAAYKKGTPPEHIETKGAVYTSENLYEEEVAVEGDTLSGLGACAGIVEGKARVLFRPDVETKLQGEILVARQTDPGWVVLFPSVKGLIVEKGSMLSHSAIVAREMGIPAVVGVRKATDRIKTGDRVRLNGSTGVIEFIEEPTPAADDVKDDDGAKEKSSSKPSTKKRDRKKTRPKGGKK